MDWCEHIEQCPCGSVGVSGSAHMDKMKTKWMFCPICGKPRPEPLKKLWERLKEKSKYVIENLQDDRALNMATSISLADEAKAAFREVVESHQFWNDADKHDLLNRIEAL